MATVTHRVATPSSVDGTSFTSGAFTPAASELLVVFVVASPNTLTAPALTDSQSLGFTLYSENDLVTNRILYVFVANALAAASSMTVTFGCTGTATGCHVLAAGISGTSRVGANAIKQKQAGSGLTGTTPTATFDAAAQAGNPTLGLAQNAANPAALTPPTNWTEQADTGHLTPTTGAEYVSRDSGFTGTAITWGATTASGWGTVIIEVDASVVVPLAASVAASVTTLATKAQTRVPLAASAATASPTLGVRAQTGIPFAASAGQSVATLALTARRVTHQVATASSVDGSVYTTASFVPSVNDLLVVFVYASATTGSATATDSQGGTYSAVLQQTLGTNRLYAFIADQLVPVATSTTVTFDCTGDAASGTNIVVESVAGMPRLGASAARQTGFATTGAGNVPQVSLGSSALTANPVFAVVGNSTSPAGLSPPSGWAEQADIGYSTPSTGLEIASLESGFTASTVTWGSSSASVHIEMVLELDTSVPVPLGASGGSSSGTLAVSVTTRITLGTSAASSSATLGVSAQTRVPLNASAASSAATLTASVPAGVPLNASAVSTTTSLSVSAQTRIPLGTSAATASPTLAVRVQTTVALGTSAASSATTLALNAPTRIALATSVASTSATLALGVAQNQVPLGSSAATATATLAVKAQTTVALGTSAATASPTLAVSAKTTVALNASAATTTTTLTLAAVGFVPLGTSAALSSATVAVKAQTQVPLATSAALASATLALSGQTVIALGTSVALSVTTLALDVGSTDQFGRPVADIATTGWTTTPLWSKLDEVTADDADLITGVAA